MFQLGPLTFLNGPLLLGLLAATIPLILHLSRSRRTKKIRFSTTRFFTDQFLRSYRMSRLRELLLLVVRMALCAFLAFALAAPLWQTEAAAGTAGGRAVVLVLDDSASMGYLVDGVPLFEKARQAAHAVLAGLGPGDTASLVLAARRADGPEVLFPEPTAERGDLAQVLNQATVTALGTDLPAAVDRALAIARPATAPNREVIVLSDLQDSGWELPSEGVRAFAGDVNCLFVQVRPAEPVNVGVSALQYGAARPLAGVPFAIRPHLTIQGQPGRALTVRLYVHNKDGQPEQVAERLLESPRPGRWPAPRLHHTFAAGGWHSGYVEVAEADGLPADNRRYFALEVVAGARLLAVNGAPSPVPRLDELFFLKTALTVSPEGKGPFQIEVKAPAELAGTDLAAFPVVILANVAELPLPAVEQLEAYVDRGGSLLVFLGDRVNAPFYNQTLAAATRPNGGLLPARLLRVEGNPAGAESFTTAGEVAADHPALATFADPKQANLGGVTFKALWGLDPGRSAVLMRTGTGAPLLCEKAYGKGRVLLFASTCDRDWTNFPMRPTYLPWAHRLVGYLAQGAQARQPFWATGEPIPVPVAQTETLPAYLARRPDGKVVPATARPDPEQPLAVTGTALAGVYRLFPAARPENFSLAAVNLDRYESDLTYLDDVLAEGATGEDRATRVTDGLRRLLGRPPGDPRVRYVADPGRAAEAATGGGGGARLWDYLLWLVLALALLEPWLANRLSLRNLTPPAPIPVARGA